MLLIGIKLIIGCLLNQPFLEKVTWHDDSTSNPEVRNGIAFSIHKLMIWWKTSFLHAN